jgi:hypothetical protein
MIRPLRRRHRVTVFALTITLPAAFAVGIASRSEVPTSKLGAPALHAEIHNQVEIWSRNDLWEKKAILTRLLRVNPGPKELAVTLSTMDRIVRPDLLVYWVPGEPKTLNSLPDDAFLLGSFEQSTPAPLTLPEPATKQVGVLVLYSLADQELVAVSKAFTAK